MCIFLAGILFCMCIWGFIFAHDAFLSLVSGKESFYTLTSTTIESASPLVGLWVVQCGPLMLVLQSVCDQGCRDQGCHGTL